MRFEKALLDAIGSVESPDYNVIYGGKRFDDFTKHPGVYVEIQNGPNKGLKSSAAGRYQFIKPTWEAIQRRLNLPDFSPESQDKAALWLAEDDYRRRTGGRNLWEDLRDPANIPNVRKVLGDTWEGVKKMPDHEFAKFFNAVEAPDSETDNSEAVADSAVEAAAAPFEEPRPFSRVQEFSPLKWLKRVLG